MKVSQFWSSGIQLRYRSRNCEIHPSNIWVWQLTCFVHDPSFSLGGFMFGWVHVWYFERNYTNKGGHNIIYSTCFLFFNMTHLQTTYHQFNGWLSKSKFNEVTQHFWCLKWSHHQAGLFQPINSCHKAGKKKLVIFLSNHQNDNKQWIYHYVSRILQTVVPNN